MLLQLSRECVKNLSDVVFLTVGIVTDVVAVESENDSLLFVRFHEITGTGEGVDCLRHPADDQVLPEKIHGFAMQTPQRLVTTELFGDEGHQYFVALRPKKFFEIHGEHLNGDFF